MDNFQPGDIILLGLQEILGEQGLCDLLASAGLEGKKTGLPLEDWAGLFSALEQRYGEVTGRGLAWRAGRSGFKHALQHYGESLGFTAKDFRLLPFERKLRAGVQALKDALKTASALQVRLAEDGSGYHLELEGCPLCQGRTAGVPSCQFALGFIQEGLYWLSGGKQFAVGESACCARGGRACSFSIPARALH